MEKTSYYASNDRLTLRNLCALDIAPIQTYLSDFDISKWTGTFPHPLPDDFASHYITLTSDSPTRTTRFIFAIIENESQMLIGTIGYWPDDRTDGGKLEIGYWIAKPYWNRGYATEAVRLMMTYLYDVVFVAEQLTLVASFQPENVATIKVLEKCAFRRMDNNEEMPSMGDCLARGGVKVEIQSMIHDRNDYERTKVLPKGQPQPLLSDTDVIETNRLRLRHLHLNDASLIQKYLNDWEVVKWLESPPHPYTFDDAVKFISSQVIDPTTKHHSAFAIDKREDGANVFIGVIGYIHSKFSDDCSTTPQFDVGYWLGREHWNHGYITEALQAMIVYLYRQFGDDLIIMCGHYAENTASANVLKKCGFVYAKENCEFMCNSLARGHPVEARKMRHFRTPPVD